MTLFGLIHGAWHSGAHWDRLIPEIEARGHRAVAIDLPCETRFVAGYVDPASRAIEAARRDDEVVVVGHSLGGYTTPHVADAVAAQHRVYLCALLQSPGKTLAETFAAETGAITDEVFLHTKDNGDGSLSWDLGAAKNAFYHDCSAVDAEWAASLLRPQNINLEDGPGPVDLRSGPSTYVLCKGDRVVSPEWSRRRVPEWMGVDPIELDGSHSPFISRPAEVADILVSVA